MTNIIQLDTSVNRWKTIAEWETAVILSKASFFENSSLDFLDIWSEIIRITNETKEYFEKEHLLQIENSKYDFVIEKLIENVYHESVMYTTDLYEWVSKEYMNWLFKQKLNWYREKLLQILQEYFLKYEYSIYKFSDFYNQEIQKKYA